MQLLTRFFFTAGFLFFSLVAEGNNEKGNSMSYRPIQDVIEQELNVNDDTIEQLVELRESELFSELPGCIPGEKERLTHKFTGILDILISNINENPSKQWVMGVFVPVLETMWDEDTEAREHFGDHLELIMDILEIESSDGLLGAYL